MNDDHQGGGRGSQSGRGDDTTQLAEHAQNLSTNYLLNSFRVFGSRFVIDARYHPLKGLGRGAYGIVISAYDSVTDQKVAIKKIPKMFADLIDAKRILRELKLLRHFQHENVIGLRDILPSYGEFEELYIVLDYMETDLHKIIYSSNVISDEHIQYFIYQILRGLKYIHSANVIHRDLKPSNILVNSNCHLKICDFGLARGYQEADYLTEYVVTRWYRAPEIMCSSDAYDYKIDVWATGCILAELLMRNPIFPGDDYKKQLNLIFNILGTPNLETDSSCITNDFAFQYIRSLPARPKVPLEKVIGSKANPLAIDLLDKMLQFNPSNRISVDDALRHPYLRHLHDRAAEPVHTTPWDSSFEQSLLDHRLTKQAIQQHLLQEIFLFRPEFREQHARRYNVPAYNPNTSTTAAPVVPASSIPATSSIPRRRSHTDEVAATTAIAPANAPNPSRQSATTGGQDGDRASNASGAAPGALRVETTHKVHGGTSGASGTGVNPHHSHPQPHPGN